MKYLFLYRKETSRPKGYVADFCVIERAVTTCRIDSVRSSRYLNFFRIGDGDFIRNDRVCCSCGFVTPGEITEYRNLVLERREPDDNLEQETNPGVSKRHSDLIQLRKRIESGLAVDAELKTSLLKEQFLWLERVAKLYWTSETKLDRVSFLFGLFSLLGWFGALIAVSKFVRQEGRLDAVGICFLVGLGLLILNAVIFFLGPRRMIGKHVIPLIAAALRPLKPSSDEVRAILAQMKTEGFRYSTKVPVRRLMTAIECSDAKIAAFRVNK